jgi:CheY-like chemotaxis protein
MDHKMPGMDGVEAARIIRVMAAEDPYYAEMPIIALTANAIAGMEQMFLENGFTAFLSKPIDTVRLGAILEKYVLKNENTNNASGTNDAAPDKMKNGGGHPGIRGIDVEKGIAATGGSAELFNTVLTAFLEDGTESIDNIKETMEGDDWPEFSTYAHAMKSASAYIGAEELSNAAKDLEAAADRGDTAFIQTNTPKFLASLKVTLEDIARYINSI